MECVRTPALTSALDAARALDLVVELRLEGDHDAAVDVVVRGERAVDHDRVVALELHLRRRRRGEADEALNEVGLRTGRQTV